MADRIILVPLLACPVVSPERCVGLDALADPNAPEVAFFFFTRHPDHYAAWWGMREMPIFDHRSLELPVTPEDAWNAMRAELYIYPISIVLGLVLLRSLLPFLRSLLFLMLGGLLTAGPWWAYQAVRWGNPLGPRVVQNVPGLGGTEMLQRLGDTTGRNWTMAWPGGGSGVEWLSVLGVTLVVLAVAALVFQRARLGQALFWISALTIASIFSPASSFAENFSGTSALSACFCAGVAGASIRA